MTSDRSPLTRLTRGPIDATALLGRCARPANGALLLFVGVVREMNDGRAVTGIEYSAYEAMAAKELADIATEAAARFGTPDIAIEHRLGELALEDASVGIAVGHPHRGGAYDASRWIIEQLKHRVPIWKREHYVDGTREWVDPVGRPAAAAARSER
ncbi:MAG TPA: molybdenum cofactor biosynthesis protein MoaE [Gemmatimonadaceae bacterium]|jgi:molybdopterin synthase catalytic subunit